MIVEDMIRFNFGKDGSYLPNNWYEGLDFEVDNLNRQTIYNWIYINKQLHECNYQKFFESLLYYFSESTNQYYDILKISLMIEVIKLIKVINHSKNDVIIEKIYFFLKNKVSSYDKLCKKVIKQYLNKNMSKAYN